MAERDDNKLFYLLEIKTFNFGVLKTINPNVDSICILGTIIVLRFLLTLNSISFALFCFLFLNGLKPLEMFKMI